MGARPAEFVETMRPWLGDTKKLGWAIGTMGVFARPLDRWREFRRWRRDNRGVQMTDSEDLATFRDEMRRLNESEGLGEGMTVANFNVVSEKVWRDELPARRRARETHREVPGGTFDEYLEAARRRLRDHGFDEDLQLLEDPKQQSERTTRIECLEFEYWWLDRRTRTAQQWEERRDLIWEKLVSSGLLKDGETQEDVLNSRSQGGDRPGSSQSKPRRNLVGRFIEATDKCRSAEIWKSSQQHLVEWARSQLPEKEPEAAPKKKIKGNAKKRGK
ncbi:hypothetical protein RB595_004858 [Gaeumannomyces hyphopodioides]